MSSPPRVKAGNNCPKGLNILCGGQYSHKVFNYVNSVLNILTICEFSPKFLKKFTNSILNLLLNNWLDHIDKSLNGLELNW